MSARIVVLLCTSLVALTAAENVPPRPGHPGRTHAGQPGAAANAMPRPAAPNRAAAAAPAAPAATAPTTAAANTAGDATAATGNSAPGAPAAETAPAGDFIILTNGQHLSGTVDDSVEGRDDKVAIRMSDGGVIRIRRDLVRQEERGFDSRRAALREGDFAGAVELATWCLSKDKRAEALQVLELALQWSANAPSPEALLAAKAMHAALVDELRTAEAALPLYQDYRAKGGTDPTTLARLTELETAIAQYQAEGQQAAQPEQPAGSAATTTAQADALEARKWDPESPQWSNPIDVKTVELDTVAGKNKVLDLTFHGDATRKGGPVDKAAIRRPMPAAALGDRTTVSMYVRNLGQKPVRMTIGVKTGEWVFHESSMQTIAVADDWKLLQFDLTASTFKSEANGWTNNGTVANLDQIKEIQFLIYNGQNDGHLQLDQIQFVTSVH